MINYPARKAFYEGYIVHTKRLAIAFILLGLVGIFFPGLLGMTTAVFVGWVMFFLGLSAAYYTYKVDSKSVLGWIKALLLIVTGLLMVFKPLAGVVALGLIVAAYLFIDAAINFSLAFTLKPAVNKIWPILNGLVSTILGVIFIMYAPNPLATSWLLGLYVGISLLFDGFMLWSLGKGADKIVVEELYIEE
ncbi:MAG: hypothetical protein GXO24_02010 [Chlorobi bacterium]|nr:hypothetical protein [Chlorobiota bacterium]